MGFVAFLLSYMIVIRQFNDFTLDFVKEAAMGTFTFFWHFAVQIINQGNHQQINR